MLALGERLRVLMGPLKAISIPYASANRGQIAQLVVAIALGVATITATGTLIHSSVASIEASWTINENSDLRVANGFAGLPADLEAPVAKVPGVAAANAYLVEPARAQVGEDSIRLHILAFDLFATGNTEIDRQKVDETALLSRLNAVILPQDFADTQGLEAGSTFEVSTRAGRQPLYVAGVVPPTSEIMRSADVVVMDLPAAQILLDRRGIVTAIDVQVDDPSRLAAVRQDIETTVHGIGTVMPADDSSPEVKGLIANLSLILNTAGSISLVVGALVIYHALEMMATRRRPHLSIIWSLGLSRRLLALLVSIEALLLAAVGVALGGVSGLILARLATGIFDDAVGTLYVRAVGANFEPSIPYLLVAGGIALGITWIIAARSGIVAARGIIDIANATPSGVRWANARRLAVLGLVLSGAGIAVPVLYDVSQPPEVLAALLIAADIPVLLGIAMVVPIGLLAVARPVSRLLGRSGLTVLRLAWQGLTSDPARSAAVMASTLIAVANVVNGSGVVSSMRSGISQWLETSQTSDLVVASRGSAFFLPSAYPIPTDVVKRVQSLDSVAAADSYRLVVQPYEDRWVTIASRDPETFLDHQSLSVVRGTLGPASKGFLANTHVFVSQHFSEKHRVLPGDQIVLRSPKGFTRLQVGAVVVDYTGDLGTIFVPSKIFEDRWRDASSTAVQIRLRDGVDSIIARDEVATALEPYCDCSVMTHSEFRQYADEIVSSSFATMYALQLVASIVMIIAVFSFFSISLAERRTQLQAVWMIGASRRQLVRSVLYEAGLISVIGSALGGAVSLWLSSRIVGQTIRTGSGMVFDFVAPVDAILATVVVCLVVSLAAAIGPALASTRSIVHEGPGD